MSSPRFGPGTGSRWQSRAEPESTTSAFSTTSYDSYSEEGTRRDTTHSDLEARERAHSSTDREGRNATYSSRDVTRDSSDSVRDITVISNKKDVTSHSRRGDSSTDTERQGSYDFGFASHEETIEWSCDEAEGYQQLSFLLLVISFLGHGVAVCTPYWVVGYQGYQMTLYEGVWLSCYRHRGEGSWICSSFDGIRHMFEQPPWYEACQVSAVLSVVLLMPALLVSTLYSYVVALRGRSRASWLLIIFLASSAFCAFLSLVIFSAAYPFQQAFPPGRVVFHASFALHVISLLLCLLSLTFHLRDSYPSLRVWENKLCGNDRLPSCAPSVVSCAVGGKRNVPSRSGSAPRGAKEAASVSGAVPKLAHFSLGLPNLSRFRAKRNNTPSAPPLERIEELSDVRETTAEPVPSPARVRSGSGVREATVPVEPVPSPARSRGGGEATSHVAGQVNAGSDSMSGYDSQV
ncbi:hypothetical protein ACOMHN_034860 [Nucella lapillus]